ncbi:MAG: N-6 DNA methylase [Candidatus Hodarchaeales archaeon]
MKLTQPELEEHFWKGVAILKKATDVKQTKEIVLALIFLKRLNDIFYEEVKETRKKGSEEIVWGNFAGNDFFIPPKARWRRLRKLSNRVGLTLNRVCNLIEENNPFLRDILTSINFDIKTRRADELLKKLIDHLSLYSLGNENFSDPRILADSFDHLIEKFALIETGLLDNVTPTNVRKLLVELIEPKEGDWICDPVTSSGSLLISCVKSDSVDLSKIYLYGQEKNPIDWAICKMNLLLHEISNSQIEQGDILREPKLIQADKPLNFDVIISNPPVNIVDNWSEVAEEDIFNRFCFGIPSERYGIFALVQHMLSTLRTDGRMAIVLDSSFLFKAGPEKKIRKKLVENDLIEAIIGLPEDLFYDDHSKRIIVLFKKSKSNTGKILFIDASDHYVQTSPKNILSDEGIQKILDSYHAFKEVTQFSRVISLKEIIQYSYNLNIPLYIDRSEPENEVDPFLLKSNLLHLEMEKQAIGQELQMSLNELENYSELGSGRIPDTWYTIQLGELVTLEKGVKNKSNAEEEANSVIISSKQILENGSINWEKVNFVSSEYYETQLQGRVKLDDVLVVRSGPNTGKTSLVRELPYRKVLINEQILIVRSKNAESLKQRYLYYLISSPLCQKQIKMRFEASSGINRDDFKTIKVPVPPIHEQKRLVKIFDTVDSSILITAKITTESQKLRRGLLQKLITGEVHLD